MKQRLLRAMGSCLWALAALACAGGSPGAVGSGKPQGNEPMADANTYASPDPNAYACQTADDCVVVEIACCDHCNGGEAVAFNKAHADKHRPKGCEGARCTRRGCAPAVPACVNNRCEVEIETMQPAAGPPNHIATQHVAGGPDDVAMAEDPRTLPTPSDSRTSPPTSPQPPPSPAKPCAKEECRGVQPMLPTQLCPDGQNTSGPACVREADGSCHWTIKRCP